MCVGSKRKFQPSSCFSFEVKLKSLDVDLLQHCSIHFVQHSKTAATTRPDSWYGAPTFTLPNKPLVIAAQSLSRLIEELRVGSCRFQSNLKVLFLEPKPNSSLHVSMVM